MLEHSIYSVISPEGCATILWRDVNQRRKAAAAAFKPTARFSYELGVVDTVVAEPSGGAHRITSAPLACWAMRLRGRSTRSRPSRSSSGAR